MCRWRYSLYVVCETTLCWGRIRLWLGAKRLLTNPSSSRMKTRIPSNAAVVYVSPGKSGNGQKNAAKVLRKCGMRLWFESAKSTCLDEDTNEWLTDLRDSKCGVLRTMSLSDFFCRISSKARWIFPSIKVEFFLYEMPMFHEDFVQFLKRCVQCVTNDEPELCLFSSG